ncbi:MAG TPA: ChbG/HpnK family deacetylase [Solirubrobacterales bacterium]|nr:ChbG/HpnK family deacetylase [Solirubrobacterales bacterium]
MPRRSLIVNADDFGQSEGINRGIIEAYERGIVTSASLMVRWSAAEAAATYGRSHPDLGLGLHFDLGEWYPRAGAWHPRYKVLDRERPEEVAAELRRQIGRFRELLSEEPTHIDSHQHAHVAAHARDATLEIAAELGVPVRHLTRGVSYCGDFYGQDAAGNPRPQAIRATSLVAVLKNLSPGVTELACHPGYVDKSLTDYATPRAEEIQALCDPRVRAVIERQRIELCSFRSAPVAAAR